MTLTEFLDAKPLDNALLLGFYGGGNYGDELLMEVLAGLLQQRGTRNVVIAYQHPESYAAFHHEFGYPRVAMHSKLTLIRAMLRQKHIIVGGGGLWGMDANLNILLMSIMLFMCRWLLGKRVYLLAVGYYTSATRAGRIGAWFAGKAANVIIARDHETYANFAAINRRTKADRDIAWYIDRIDADAYQPDLAQLDAELRVAGNKTLFITLRRFRGAAGPQLKHVVENCLANSKTRPIIIALMEPRQTDPAGWRQLEAWHERYPHIQIIDFSFNPLALFLFFRKHHDQLLFIGPQFHAILSAHLTGVPYLPLVYDNKVRNLLETIAPHITPITVKELTPASIQHFIDQLYPSQMYETVV